MSKRTLPSDNYQHHGFTLMELLVVFALIGIIAGTAIISYTPPPFRETRESMQNLQSKISVAQERALLGGVPIGIVFFQDRYIFMIIKDKQWQKDSIGEVEIDLIAAQLYVEERFVRLPDIEDEDVYFPQVVFLPTAEMTEFKLTVPRSSVERSESVLFELTSDLLGRAKLEEFRSNF